MINFRAGREFPFIVEKADTYRMQRRAVVCRALFQLPRIGDNQASSKVQSTMIDNGKKNKNMLRIAYTSLTVQGRSIAES